MAWRCLVSVTIATAAPVMFNVWRWRVCAFCSWHPSLVISVRSLSLEFSSLCDPFVITLCLIVVTQQHRVNFYSAASHYSIPTPCVSCCKYGFANNAFRTLQCQKQYSSAKYMYIKFTCNWKYTCRRSSITLSENITHKVYLWHILNGHSVMIILLLCTLISLHRSRLLHRRWQNKPMTRVRCSRRDRSWALI